MPKSIQRTYSGYSRDATELLGGLIQAARKEQKLTAQEISDCAGISRGLLQRIEKGDLKCEIGVVYRGRHTAWCDSVRIQRERTTQAT